MRSIAHPRNVGKALHKATFSREAAKGSIFTRALGLNVMFAGAPERAVLADEFIRNYYRYADQLYASRQNQTAFTSAEGLGFEFEIFASGEYARLLEREWEEG